MTTFDKINSIVSRHHADRAEADRACRACGRPWPCDVQQLAMAYATDPGTVTAVLAKRDHVRRAASRRTAPAATVTA